MKTNRVIVQMGETHVVMGVDLAAKLSLMPKRLFKERDMVRCVYIVVQDASCGMHYTVEVLDGDSIVDAASRISKLSMNIDCTIKYRDNTLMRYLDGNEIGKSADVKDLLDMNLKLEQVSNNIRDVAGL